MPKPLTRTPQKIYHYVDGVKVDGAHKHLHGDVTGLRGDVTGLWGDVTGLRGDVNEIPYSARPCYISDWIEK